jgi:hypothetical protein
MSQVASSTIEIAPLPMNLEIGLVDIPGCSGLTTSICSQLISHHRRKPFFPVPNGLMSENKATFKEHLSHITQAQLIAQVPENDKENDICRNLKIVEESESLIG